jgi:delta24(24(1))-sterol reductase
MTESADALLSLSFVYKGVLALILFVGSLHYLFVSSSSLTFEKVNKQTHKGDGTIFEALGHFTLFLFSHFICYYLWWAAEFNHGEIGNPFPITQEVWNKATPNTQSLFMYGGLILSQLLCSAILPGPTVLGFPIPQEGNRRLSYKCNGLAGWYVSVAVVSALHYFEWWDLKTLYRNSGSMLSTAILFADIVAIFIYLECCRTRRSDGSLHYLAHDFVMGQYLNPRFYWNIDLKLWAEIRVSWLLLFGLEVSCALCLKEELGYIPNRMWIVLWIHGLYTNACMKGEESIPYTWDIFQECWGWMLIYWNLAGVAFAYTFNSRFLYAQAHNLEELPPIVFLVIIVASSLAYWVFDEANAQKNRFRAQKLSGAFVQRPWAIPQMPNATLVNPVFLQTKRGSALLMDGWWKYARKPHYTADMILAIFLCVPCGFQHALPYFFVCFFIPVLIHRELRDSAKCAQKYGDDWVEYCKQVPYVFIPGIY